MDSITDDATDVALTGDGHADAAITVAVGKPLTIGANITINVAAQGAIKLAKPTSGGSADGTILNLNVTTAKIAGLTGGNSNRTLLTANIANATYAVGSSTGEITGGGSNDADGAYIASGNDQGPNPIKAKDDASADVTINNATEIGSD